MIPTEPGSGRSASPWSDLDRPPLSAARLQRALGRDGWRVEVVERTGSTNADVVAAASRGEPAGLVRVAEWQDSGRGRLRRSWQAPPRSSLLMSVLLRPSTPPSGWTLLPLLAGLAVAEAVRAVGRVDATLKWPNDVLLDERKLGGILVERIDSAVVIGVGLNVSMRAEELPLPTATSLAVAGGGTDREILAKELVRALGRRYRAWTDAGGAPEQVLPAYREICATIGRDVRIEQPGGGALRGVVRTVDDTGRLVVVDADGVEHAVSVGDVVHVRVGG